MKEKEQISARLREEIREKYGSLKTLADEIGKSLQYLNMYVSGINAPGPKVRKLLQEAGLDVPYIMTGRRGGEGGGDEKELRQLRAVMKEKGIKNVDELRERLEKEEALVQMLGREAYETFVQAAAVREKRSKYIPRKKRSPTKP